MSELSSSLINVQVRRALARARECSISARRQPLDSGCHPPLVKTPVTRTRPIGVRALSGIAALSLAATGLALVGASPAAAAPVTLYDSRPDVPASTYSSLAFLATQTSQFGDLVQLDGENRRIAEVVVNLTS